MTVADLIVIMLVAIILVTVFGVLYFIASSVETEFAKIPNMNVTYITKAKAGIGILINGIPFITLAFGMTAMVMAFMIPSHPIFAPISVFILAVYIILSTFFSNIFYDLTNNTFLTAVFNEFPLVVYFMQYLPIVITVIGALIIIIEYSKAGGISRTGEWE